MLQHKLCCCAAKELPYRGRPGVVSLLVLMGLMLLSSVWIGSRLYDFNEFQMDTDEAVHAVRGLEIASAIARRGWADLGYEATKAHWYPPAHGFMQGAWFLLFGLSVFVARAYSTFCYFVLGLLLYFCARQALPRSNRLLWLVPPLFLASDSLHLTHAAMSMLEIPAMMLCLGAFLAFNRAQQGNRALDHLVAAFAGLGCFLVKYNYGLMVFAAMAACYAAVVFESGGGKGEWLHRVRPIAAGWLPVGVLLIVWLFVLGEWKWLLAYATAQPPETDFLSIANLAYYPRLLCTKSMGWLAVPLFLLGAIMWGRDRRVPRVLQCYVAFFCIGMVLLTCKLKNDPRFGMLLMPPVWICAAWTLGRIEEAAVGKPFRRWAGIAAMIVVAVAAVQKHATLSSRLSVVYENSNTAVNAAYDFVAEAIEITNRRTTFVIMLGKRGQWNGQALRFHLASKYASLAGYDLTVLDDEDLNRGWPRTTFPGEVRKARYYAARDKADFIVVFSAGSKERKGWRVIAERVFVFERVGTEPLSVRVGVMARAG